MRHPLTDRVESAAEVLHGALNPGDELRGPREDVHEAVAESWANAIRLLNSAEDVLDTGVGGGDPGVAEGIQLAGAAADELERSREFVKLAPADVQRAFADALRDLDAVTGS